MSWHRQIARQLVTAILTLEVTKRAYGQADEDVRYRARADRDEAEGYLCMGAAKGLTRGGLRVIARQLVRTYDCTPDALLKGLQVVDIGIVPPERTVPTLHAFRIPGSRW